MKTCWRRSFRERGRTVFESKKTSMRILYVAPMLPWPLATGTHLRCFHLVKGLAKDNEVFVATPPAVRDADRIESERLFLEATGCRAVHTAVPQQEPSPNDVATGSWAPMLPYLRSLFGAASPPSIAPMIPKTLIDLLKSLRERECFDRVVACRLWMGESALAAGFKTVMLDVDDVQSEVFSQSMRTLGWYKRRLLHEVELLRLRSYERTLYDDLAKCSCAKVLIKSFLVRTRNRRFRSYRTARTSRCCHHALPKILEPFFLWEHSGMAQTSTQWNIFKRTCSQCFVVHTTMFGSLSSAEHIQEPMLRRSGNTRALLGTKTRPLWSPQPT